MSILPTLQIYTASWCVHCQHLKPHLLSFLNKAGNEIEQIEYFKDYDIIINEQLMGICVIYDNDNENIPDGNKVMYEENTKKQDINGFPTLVFNDGEKTYKINNYKINNTIYTRNNPDFYIELFKFHFNNKNNNLQCGGGNSKYNKKKYNKINNNDEYYKMKYFKYKAKYLKLLEQ